MTLTVPQEALLKTLAVMTLADTNIKQMEVEAVRQIMQEEMGVSVSSAEVRVAAHSEFINDKEIHKYLKSVASDLDVEDKQRIVRALQKIIRLDDKAHFYEIEMFNEVANALKLTPAELVQL